MSDAPPPVRAESTPDGRLPAAALTADRIDSALADFRGWLDRLAEDPGAGPPGSPGPTPVDLATLVAQFTALRHEVNLQTKSTRAAVEQNAEALKLLAQPPKPPIDSGSGEAVRPLVKALIDVADALTISVRHVEKAQAAAAELLAAPPPRPRPRLFAHLFGAGRTAAPSEPPAANLRSLLAGVADGYAMSLRRVERVLPQFGLEAIDCVGRPFDPELMEVLEAVDGNGRPGGIVVEEVRRGYRWNGTVFRFAQVRVTR